VQSWSILEIRVVVIHRLFALALSLLLFAGNGVVCQGWASTPEARLACCADDETCPMHKDERVGSGVEHDHARAAADACCAASESHQSNEQRPTTQAVFSSPILGPGVLVPVIVPQLVTSDAWRTAVPIPAAPVPRHVLLSVFLI
jgi:hypothetical protein